MDYKKIKKIFVYSIFLIIFIMSYIHPYYADDYYYSFVYGTNKKISSLKDIVISGRNLYLNWSGRIISNFLQNLFTFIGKESFSILNAIIFLYIIYFGKKIINEILNENNNINNELEEKEKIWDGFIIFILIWFFIPAFSEDFIWLVGSSNYGWMLFILEIYIYKFLKIKESSKDFNVFIIAFIAGLTNESSIIFSNIFSIIFILLKFKNENYLDKKRIKVWGCLVLSSCISIFAIGNFKRLFNENTVMFPKNTINEKIIYMFLIREVQILIILILILILIAKLFIKIKIKEELIMFYSMILTYIFMIIIMPRNEKRALLIPVYFMILFFSIIIKKIRKKYNNKLIKKLIFYIVGIIFFFSLTKILNFYLVEIYNIEKRRNMLINYYISTNSKEAIFEHYGIHEKNLYNHKIFDYIWKNPTGIGNISFSLYHNFDKTYAIQKENELLIIKFKDNSNIDNIKIHLKSTEYDLDAHIDKSTMEFEKTLYVEIPKDTYEINIEGDQFEILNTRILKIIKGEIYNKDGNIKNIKLETNLKLLNIKH